MADSVGTRFGAVLSCLSVGLPYVRKWPFTARRYQVSGMADGRCCMYGYGPNYVKFSRVFAVQLFGVFIGHYAALPPVRSDPLWPHSHTTTASIRLALTHTLQQHPLLATRTSAVVTTTCIDYLHSHTRTRRPSTASPICSAPALNGYWVRHPRSPLALDKTRQHPLLATQTSGVATKMSWAPSRRLTLWLRGLRGY
jgi:hypothetical protein